eukprot:CAMPEP_0174248860 /NCGR_PEP_ID=MMETSP0417-20130205/43290_1 /TAXON_ID=242541 /ORGANISM="Mayorella sp, Strain BSH-02190019" /LENGTH=600 /DNA_ID=CAMNT_0015328727 /DNA_START=92 /DNA_END=1894 /DNA_ORIENTATION=+
MAATQPDLRRKKVEEIWDLHPKKLTCLVVEATGLMGVGKRGRATPWVNVILGKRKYKTEEKKHNLNPSWMELFHFEVEQCVDRKKQDFMLEVWTKKGMGEMFLGQVVVGKPDEFEPEKIYDVWMDLKGRAGKKGRKDKPQGRLHLRYTYSTEWETRPSKELEYSYFYKRYMHKFDTGDLIVYDERGLLPALTKLTSNSDYSRVGIVLKLANKWTQEQELYVAEVTRNIDKFQDAYRENASNGISVFRLFERIHGIYANAIWYAELKEKLGDEQRQKLTEWMWKVHDQTTAANISQTLQPSDLKARDFIIERFNHLGRYSNEVTEYYGVSFVSHCLETAGIVDELLNACKTWPADLVTNPAYAEAVKIRCIGGDADGADPPPAVGQPILPFGGVTTPMSHAMPPAAAVAVAAPRAADSDSESESESESEDEAPHQQQSAYPGMPGMPPHMMMQPGGPMMMQPGGPMMMQPGGPMMHGMPPEMGMPQYGSQPQYGGPSSQYNGQPPEMGAPPSYGMPPDVGAPPQLDGSGPPPVSEPPDIGEPPAVGAPPQFGAPPAEGGPPDSPLSSSSEEEEQTSDEAEEEEDSFDEDDEESSELSSDSE